MWLVQKVFIFSFYIYLLFNHWKMVVILMLNEMSLKFYSIADWWIHFYFYSHADEVDVEFFHLDTMATVL